MNLSKHKKWLPLTLKFLVSAALIWFLLGKVDLAATKAHLLEVAPGMFVLALAILLVQVAICVFRWKAVLHAIRAPLSFFRALEIFMIGSFFSQTLPSSVGGDAVRMYKAYRTGLTLSGAVNGVMLDRAVTVVGLVLLALAMQPFFLPKVGAEVSAWLVPAIVLFVAVMAAGLAFVMILDRLPESLRRWRLVRGLALLAADTRRVFLAPGAAFRSLGWAVVGHTNLTLGVYVLALGLGLGVTWIDCIVLFPPVLLITTLPISIAGWGVREVAMVAAFGLVGIPAEGAFALSLLFGLLAVVVGLVGGVVWLLSSDRRRDLEAEGVTLKSVADGQAESRG